ncbi:hypothetical protein L208DRAFT_1378406 [Tricholoma matsutake]|nr:hypothetical protein L208DRAFT_1378406 [Tricholoma matsutake 945]
MMVLQRVYCGHIRRQLGAKETKDSKNGGKGKKLDENLPPLLTGSAFFNRVKQQEAVAEAAEQEHKARKQKKLDLVAKVENWKTLEAERKMQNQDLEVKWKAAVEEWETRKAEVKASGRKIKDWTQANPRPKKNDPKFKQEKALPKPKMMKPGVDMIEESDGELFDFENLSDDEE